MQNALADELQQARATRRADVVPPSARGAFDLDAAYVVERELSRRRQAEGRTIIGHKVGYANKAVWRALKLDTLVWAGMYDDTVRHAPSNEATLSIAPLVAPKIEPEIVFRLRDVLPPGLTEPAAVLEAVEWIALGFEIIDCVFPDWKYEPADFVASAGLHAALIVGDPRPVLSEDIGVLVGELSGFQLRLSKGGEQVDEGSGRNSLRSPALCVAELAAGLARQHPHDLLREGELISSGTLTTSWPIAPGQSWSATVEGLGLAPLELRLT
jgi:2-oxo-3-hexenedioate decarboxylase